MTKQDKLLAKLLRRPPPKDFSWGDWTTLANRHGFEESCSGGSHYTFQHPCGFTFTMSKTHPSGVLKAYQVKAAIEAIQRVTGREQ